MLLSLLFHLEFLFALSFMYTMVSPSSSLLIFDSPPHSPIPSPVLLALCVSQGLSYLEEEAARTSTLPFRERRDDPCLCPAEPHAPLRDADEDGAGMDAISAPKSRTESLILLCAPFLFFSDPS